MKIDLRDLVHQLLEKEEAERLARAKDEQARHDAYMESRIEIWDAFLQFCRPATVDDYLAWLKLYIQKYGTEKVRYLSGNLEEPVTRLQGGFGPGIAPLGEDVMTKIEADSAKLYVLTATPQRIPVAHGALSFRVIVPSTILLPRASCSEASGHNEFYFMDDGSTNAPWVNIYDDVAQKIMSG